jgi:cytoskeletal protein RodZ
MPGSPSDRKVNKRKGKIVLPPLALVGQDIANARKKRRMTTLKVSQITRIPERYVQCIEAGDFASLPAKPFVFGFTRTICGLLALDADACIAAIKSEMYESCTDEPGIQPPLRSAATMLRRLGRG